MRNIKLFTYLIVFCFLINHLAIAFDEGDNYKSTKSFLVRVIDGDTIIVTIPNWPSVVGNDIPVRIANIDSPGRACAIDWDRSREYLISLIGSSKTFELRNIQRGKYFRLIAEVWVDGGSLGERMVGDGYAVEYGQGKDC